MLEMLITKDFHLVFTLTTVFRIELKVKFGFFSKTMVCPRDVEAINEVKRRPHQIMVNVTLFYGLTSKTPPVSFSHKSYN